MVVMVLLLPLFCFVPEGSAQEVMEEHFEFEFYDDRKADSPVLMNFKEIEAGAGDPCLVVFEGKLKLITQIPQGRQVVVWLSSEMVHNPDTPKPTRPWTHAVFPPVLYFDATTDECDVNVVVRCAQFEDKGVTQRIIIGGTYQNNPGLSGIIEDDETHILEVTTAQFFRPRVTSPETFNTGYPGERRQFTLEIYNDGTGLDAFQIDFTNMDVLTRQDFVIEYNTLETEEVLPGETANFTFWVTSPEKTSVWKTGIHEISLEISSEGAGNLGEEEMVHYSVFYQEKGTYYDTELCMGAMLVPLLLIPMICFFIWGFRKWWEYRSIVREYERDSDY